MGPMAYLTNDVGDVYAMDAGSDIVPVAPESFGWAAKGGRTTPECRRSLDQIESLPGFSVTPADERRFVPGPRPRRSAAWMSWKDGAAPPAAALSKAGESGTLAYCDRLTDALGLVAMRLPGRPDRSPFLVYDFVSGQRFTLAFDSPPLSPGGAGTVYVLDDGDACKIGFTAGYVAARVAGLQTGNPRVIRTVATVAPTTGAVEAHLHAQLGAWNRRGEWFDHVAVVELVTAAGGWEVLLRRLLPDGDWTITVFGDRQLDP